MSPQTRDAANKIIRGRNKLAAKIISALLTRHTFTESYVERASINRILASVLNTPLTCGEPTTNTL